MSDLIDTTEMYLRTIYELTEEGVLPMRARIAERLGQSGPTVSQTVARMQRDGLVELDQEDRHLVLTPAGAELATRVMRKHRLAECLLVDVIGLPWEDVHTEACRWEHVMSDAVERRLFALLEQPTASPFGNPIPGLGELAGSGALAAESLGPLPGRPITAAAVEGEAREVAVAWIGETLQADEAVMADLRRVGAVPGGEVQVMRVGDRVRIGQEGASLDLPLGKANRVIAAEA